MGRKAFLCAFCCWAVSVFAVEQVNTETDRETVVSYSWSDIDTAMAQVADSFLASRKIQVPGVQMPVIAISRVTNDTCQHLDMMVLTEKLVAVILEDGRYDVSAVFADAEAGRETMIGTVRTARGDAEYDASTLQQKGLLKAPDFAIGGKLVQQNVRRDNGGWRVEYHLAINAVRLKDGNKVWEKSVRIIKNLEPGAPVW